LFLDKSRIGGNNWNMFYITTPLPYVNGEPHLGHLLEHTFTDTIRRYRQRVETQEVRLEYGVDQHGLKIYQKALELGQKPEEFVKQKSLEFHEIWKKYDCQSDVFIDTDSENHKLLCQIIFRKLLQKDLIYKKSYTGLYCIGCEDFYAESQLDENKCCPIHKVKPVEMNEENYFFRLSTFESKVREYLNYAKSKNIIEPSPEEWINFMSEGLQDISMSREKSRMPWGIEMFLPDGTDTEQVMYVWFEALQNYWTALVNPETFDKWREMPELRAAVEEEILDEIREGLPIDFMYLGKDIAKFHIIIWTAMHFAMDLAGFEKEETEELLADATILEELDPTENVDLEKLKFSLLPQKTLVHGFINDAQGRKFSKSLGNGVLPEEIFAQFGVDGTRFVMLREVNIFGDTSFYINRIIESYNSSLADNLGNVVMRVSTLIEKYFNGKVDVENVEITKLNVNLIQVYKELENFYPQKAMQELFIQTAKINAFLEETKPWTLGKDFATNEPEIRTILTQSARALIEIGKALSIFMPESGAKIVEIFTAEKIAKAEVLFPKIVVEE
jgi:methionyl-tRNA synthetase